MRHAARMEYEAKYMVEANMRCLEGIYAEIINKK
jgi:hypothetical protein